MTVRTVLTNTVIQNSLFKRTLRNTKRRNGRTNDMYVESGNFPLQTLKYELLRTCNGLFNIYFKHKVNKAHMCEE